MSGTQTAFLGVEDGPESGTLPVASPARTRAALAALVRPHGLLAAVALVVLVGATCVQLTVAPLLGHIVNLVVHRSGPGAITKPVVLLAVVAVGAGALTTVGTWLATRLGEQMLARLREAFLDKALGLPLDQVERGGSGDLTSRVTNDVAKIGEGLRYAVPQFTRSALLIVLTGVGLVLLDWRFLLAAAVGVPIQLLTARWYIRNSMPLYSRQRRVIGQQQQQLLDTVGGAATVRAFGLEAEQTGRVATRSRANADLGIAEIRLQTRFFNLLNLAELVSLCAILTTGWELVEHGQASVGQATAAALYFHALMNPIIGVLFLLDQMQLAVASLARLVGVVDLPDPPRPGAEGVPQDSGIRVAGLCHEYVPGHPVLREVDLVLLPARRTALVGASGAGKTTLARIVAGVHEPIAGTVALGGVPLGALDPGLVRRQVVLVTQEVHVFAGTLAEDLRLAAPQAGEDALHSALREAGALDWALGLPKGLDTVVGEGGLELSATQAQQLALARLVLTDPPVAVLDEATADAGSAGARVLEEAARRALAGRTALVVAHRLAQAVDADQIVVLDEGRVVGVGTHSELLAGGGHYTRLWEAWTGSRT